MSNSIDFNSSALSVVALLLLVLLLLLTTAEAAEEAEEADGGFDFTCDLPEEEEEEAVAAVASGGGGCCVICLMSETTEPLVRMASKTLSQNCGFSSIENPLIRVLKVESDGVILDRKMLMKAAIMPSGSLNSA